MMNPTRWLAPPLAVCSLLLGARAQSLELDVVGGSMPGPLVLDAGPGNFPFELMLIVPSSQPGPTPIQLFDPNDLRSLEIGLDLVSLAWATAADLTTLRGTVQTQLPAQPALVDQALYFQAVTFQWLPTLLDRISNGNVIRLGLAGTFRDRFVQMFEERAFATALLREDRKTLVIGGARGQLLAQVATATTEVYDPRTDAFTYGPMMTAPRSLHTMTQLDDGRWLVTGGVDGSNDPQATCEIYDPIADAFVPAAQMGSPRMGHTATKLGDGRVLVTGGLDAVTVTPSQLSAIRDAVDTTEIYDPTSDTWTPGPTMNDPRAAHVALHRPDGKVLLCGGISWEPNPLFGWVPAVRASCDLYDPATNTIAVGPAMASQRALVEPVEIAPGRWLLAGGMNGLSIIPFNPGNPTAAAEVYDATTNAWTSVGAMATARANHKAFALGDGTFLLAGGAANSILSPTPLQSTEVFDPTTGVFTPGPTLNSARAGATQFLTPQGQMQLIGGADGSATISRTTEWYYF